MSHEHYEGCGHVRYGELSDLWDRLHGTTPQSQEASDKNKEINEGRNQNSGDGKYENRGGSAW